MDRMHAHKSNNTHTHELRIIQPKILFVCVCVCVCVGGGGSMSFWLPNLASLYSIHAPLFVPLVETGFAIKSILLLFGTDSIISCDKDSLRYKNVWNFLLFINIVTGDH